MKTQLQIGSHLKDLRSAKGLTLSSVSIATGIDCPLLSKIERGQRLPTIKQIEILAKYYQVTLSHLKVKLTATKILKQYGVNSLTHQAIVLVENEISVTMKNKRA